MNENIGYTEQMENILNNFDFEQARRVMFALNWTWRTDSVPPSIYRMIKTSRQLLREVAFKGSLLASSGGFVAENIDGILTLSFVVESWRGDML